MVFFLNCSVLCTVYCAVLYSVSAKQHWILFLFAHTPCISRSNIIQYCTGMYNEGEGGGEV